MKDAKLKYFDQADISTSPTSDVVKFPASGDESRTGVGNRVADNVSGAIYLNVQVNADITGAEVVTLEDSADGSSWAATDCVITVGAASAGDHFSKAIPSTLRQYTRVAETIGTVGTITVSLGQKLPDSLI